MNDSENSLQFLTEMDFSKEAHMVIYQFFLCPLKSGSGSASADICQFLIIHDFSPYPQAIALLTLAVLFHHFWASVCSEKFLRQRFFVITDVFNELNLL